MTTHPLPPRLSLFAAAVAPLLALVLTLTGCGPGVGGTGTGAAIELTAFGARALPVCASELAPQLACGGTALGPATSGPDAGGTAPLRLLSADGRVVLQLDGNRAGLDAPCRRLRFDGRWGQVGPQAPLFLGGVTVGDDPTPRPATLRAVPGDDGTLRLELRDADGTSLLGPLTVRPAADGAPAAACPG